MAHIHTDVQAEFFTPPEFPVEILNEAKETDVIPCCLPSNAKQFFTFMLIKEYYYKTNGVLVFIQDEKVDLDSSMESGDTDLDITDSENLTKEGEKQFKCLPVCDPPLESLSSIPVINLRDKVKGFSTEYQKAKQKFEEMFSKTNNKSLLESNSVVILCTAKDFISFIQKHTEYASFLSRLRLVIIDNVHEALVNDGVKMDLLQILKFVRKRNEAVIDPKTGRGKIRMIYLTVPLLHFYGYASAGFWRMEETFRNLEKFCDAKVDTSSDIVALLRYCPPLTERIVSCSTTLQAEEAIQLTLQVKTKISVLKKFFTSHVFNPVEALGYQQEEWDDLLRQRAEASTMAAIKNEAENEENVEDADSLVEEVKNIPHPKTSPLQLLEQFEEILDIFGPWCANRSLYLFINQIKKLKTRVPYVRHYLLLGLLHSRFAMIQASFQTTFDNYEPLEALEKFSTPKLLTVLNILRRFNLTQVHEGKLLRQQEEQLQQQLEDLDEDGDLTVADYLKAQKQQGQAARNHRPRRRGRQRKNFRPTSNSNKTVSLEEEGKISPTDTEVINSENCVEQPSGSNAEATKESADDTNFEPLKESILNSATTNSEKCIEQSSGTNVEAAKEPADDTNFEHLKESILNSAAVNSEKCVEQSSGTNVESAYDTNSVALKESVLNSATKNSEKSSEATAESADISFEPLNQPILNSEVINSEICVEQSDKANVEAIKELVDVANSELSNETALNSTGDNAEIKVPGNDQIRNLKTGTKSRRQQRPRGFKKVNINPEPSVALSSEASCSQDGEQLSDKVTTDKPVVTRYYRRNKNQKPNEDILCGILLLEHRFHARLLYHFLREAADVDPKLIGLSPTIALPSNPEYGKDSREAEIEYKRREENLRKFRYRDANFLVGTSLLEDGIELPKSNLVIRFDESKSFRSYLFSKGRAQGNESEYYILTSEEFIDGWLRQLATYKMVEEVLLSRTVIPIPSYEPPIALQNTPLDLNQNIPVFKSATLSNAISFVNRYCARLPSDTFTRLTSISHIDTVYLPEKGVTYFRCSLRLPINSPIKWPIQGIPMPTQALAKKAVAVQTVMVLHNNGELDDALLPVGKEAVPQEPDLCITAENAEDFGEFRPGSTRRRQYYDKQLAPQLKNCLPSTEKPFYLYWLRMKLVCPLPDDQNTRGRKLHPPEDAAQCFGIGLSKLIPPMPPFPIYTRCGEVLVELVRIQDDNNSPQLTKERLERISAFHHYTFTSVLRLDKYLTLFDPDISENSFYVLPLKACGKRVKDSEVQIDWDFIDVIWKGKDVSNPVPQEDESRKSYVFCKENYVDAVVMPWYRNNDQPQYFYVAEICQNLTPQSQFPGCEFKTFEEYYRKKYKLTIQHPTQPLLDVDHTSARLNFLTPRYVNRKGMALPTSSETTRKAKRENLEQKQILVPELCAIHPFTASLWRQAVCLPCILYRVNALLMANNIRTLVASQICGLGLVNLPDDHNWKPLNFGWSLGDVFPQQNAEPTVPAPAIKEKEEKEKEVRPEEVKVQDKVKEEKSDEKENKKPEISEKKPQPQEAKKKDKDLSGFEKAAKEPTPQNITFAESLLTNNQHKGKSLNEILSEEMKKCRQPQLEIGVWSNEMATGASVNEPDYDDEEDELLDPNVALPSNLMMIDKNVSWGGRYKLFNHKVHRALYGSPTHWGEVWDRTAFEPPEDFDDIDSMSIHSDMSGSDESFLDGDNNLKIQFEGNTAEALDKRKFATAFDSRIGEEYRASEDLWWPDSEPLGIEEGEGITLKEEFDKKVDAKMADIQNIVKWNELRNFPPRQLKKHAGGEEVATDTTSVYIDLIKKSAPLNPPSSFPVSDIYLKNENKEEETQLEPEGFSFDYQPSLVDHVGPSPCQILQALTMSNANDGLNLERLETIGDSFLKYAITTYLFCTFENIHEGKLSHLRSKQVSNVHLYRLGRKRYLGGLMIAAKFEPHDNWLPPCYHIPRNLEKFTGKKAKTNLDDEEAEATSPAKHTNETIPYNLVTQQSIPDKSIADSVEALIGAYLTTTGPFGALLFMSWLGVRVLPSKVIPESQLPKSQFDENGKPIFYMKIPSKAEVILFANLKPPASPLLRYEADCETELEVLLKGYDGFEESIGYKFRDRSYLLQAFTHASYAANKLTDCYQRLEFLGDAILDYLITRHLYEDPRQHSPGSLTDLRSALVNNTIFASLAVKHGFHKYFRHASPGLSGVLQKFVTFQEQHSHTLTQDYYLMGEEECEEAEDIEVPKALGDVFESVAGAIYLDSNMSLDAVWKVYYRIMKNEIEQFSQNVPKSPIRELLELEPETAKFGKPEKLWDGRRVRVIVEIFGIGVFRGIGRNYRIAKCTAAKCALRHVRKFRQGHKKT